MYICKKVISMEAIKVSIKTIMYMFISILYFLIFKNYNYCI